MSEYTSNMTPEERAALVAKVKEMYAAKRSRGETDSPPSPEETLDELSRDDREGRDLKWDLRCNAGERHAWSQAARAMGLTQSEWARDVMNAAAAEVLSPV